MYRLEGLKELVMDVRVGFCRRVHLSKDSENLEESCGQLGETVWRWKEHPLQSS